VKITPSITVNTMIAACSPLQDGAKVARSATYVMNHMATTTMGLKLDDETRERLTRLSAVKARSPHWLMKEAVRQYLDHEETYQREREADRVRWERYERTGAFLDNQTMNDWLDGLVGRAGEKADGR